MRSLNERISALQKLRDIFKDDVPAIILYSPVYTFAYHQDVHGIEMNHPSLHSDRFLSLDRWYLRQSRVFLPNKNWFSFFSWLKDSIS